MKKSLLIIAAVAMSFVACSKEEIQTVSKGMTLSANVADDNTKATITDNGDKTWSFSWEVGDVVSVTSPSGETYPFVYDGTSFKCETADPEAGKWTAVYYPADFETNGFDLRNQDGTKEYVADHMLLKGDKTYESAVSTLSMTMEKSDKLAVLALTNNSDSADAKYAIRLSDSEAYYTKLRNDGSWETNGSKSACFLHAFDKIGQTQYFLVPAGVSIIVKGFSFDSGAKILTAGKVYKLTTTLR